MRDAEPRKHARRGDPDTSHTSAAMLRPKARMMRRLLVEFARDPLTSDEACERAGFVPADGAWRRVSDLSVAGLVEDTGCRRIGRSGRPQMVRAITDEGMAELVRR